jgi:hypothetical protein
LAVSHPGMDAVEPGSVPPAPLNGTTINQQDAHHEIPNILPLEVMAMDSQVDIVLVTRPVAMGPCVFWTN